MAVLMKRREFFQKTALFGIAAYAGLAKDAFPYIYRHLPEAPALPYDLVAVKNGDPVQMFDRGIAALGGMSAFVKKNQKVVIKPNIGWDVTPEKAANTNPALVGRIVQACYAAGAKSVYVFDNTCDNWQRSYKNSGIEKAVKDAGGILAPGNTENYYQDITIKGAKRLPNAKVHELVLSSDVFINVPILKNHGSTKLTISMKNMMGVVWDRKFWHRNDLHQCIADFGLWRRPDLNIVDCYAVMKQNGPRGTSQEDVMLLKSLLIGKDMVAVDSAATKVFGMNPEEIQYIKNAEALKLGTTNLDKLKIQRIKVS
jgi:uncharacterized protein (DUF362 family)